MHSNNKHSTKELEKFIQMYLEGGHSYSVFKKNYGLLISQFRCYIINLFCCYLYDGFDPTTIL